MYCDSKIHPGLAAILEFEEYRLGLPIEAHSLHLMNAGLPFRPVIEINIHTARDLDRIPVLFDNEVMELSVAAHMCDDNQFVGFADRNGDLCPLAGITGNRLNIYVDLNRVFRNPGDVGRKPLNGSKVCGHPGNRIADLILARALPIIVGNIRRHDWKQEGELYTRAKLSAQEETARRWERNVRENGRAIEEKTFEINSLARKNAELREQLRLRKLVTNKRREREATEEHAQLRQLLGRSLRQIEVRDGHLKTLTTPIDIDHHGYQYEFGCFWIHVPLNGGRLEIRPENTGNEVDDFSHPHIASDGYPCLGNIGSTLAQLLGEGRMFEAVTLMLEFLRSYNPDNPYLRIERWNPDWEDDDDRFESCYNNASLSDCATCNDEDCPYQDGSARRCVENTDTEDCIECNSCGERRHAIEHCRNNNEHWECVQCQTQCPWAGDAESCRAMYAGDQCTDCPNDDCNYYIEEENDEDDNREVPAVAAAGG